VCLWGNSRDDWHVGQRMGKDLPWMWVIPPNLRDQDGTKNEEAHMHAQTWLLIEWELFIVCLFVGVCPQTSDSQFIPPLTLILHHWLSRKPPGLLPGMEVCITGLPGLEASSFWTWAAPGSSSSPASDPVSQANKSSLLILLAICWLCSSREP
jgi:hypothetical protein